MFTAGDHSPVFTALDTTGKKFHSKSEVGYPKLIVFSGSVEHPENVALLKQLQLLLPAFNALSLKLVNISPNPVETLASIVQQHAFSFSLLSDLNGELAALFSVGNGSQPFTKQEPIAFLLDQNLMFIGVFSPFKLEDLLTIYETVRICSPVKNPVVVTDSYTPPVLLLPDVLDYATCEELIHIWEYEGNQISHFMRADGEKTYGVVDASVKIRRDHFIINQDVKERINAIFQRRIYPQMEKCLNAVVDEYEHFKIVCYDAATGGYFRQHRDNTSGGTAHRQWALSLNLNAGEYEGGYLRFPEYGPQLYKPATGSAIVFSCSLMHEATEVTAGKRFVLLSFFYGEQESKARKQYQQRFGTKNYIPEEVRQSVQKTAPQKEPANASVLPMDCH
jgi:peroxiredoxin/predicted 2-oxoglutarate/Fe(II)-dependent dioxygenase YbiX